jgi:hypothetical protein
MTQFRAPREGNPGHALHRQLRSRPGAALYVDVLGGEMLLDAEPSIVALANSGSSSTPAATYR